MYDDNTYQSFEIDSENTKFEWNEEKARKNFSSHGIKFETVMRAFNDPGKLCRVDELHSTGKETRYNVLAKVNNVLFIVCIFKEDDVIRIISARHANKKEKERYNYGNGNDDIGGFAAGIDGRRNS